MYIGQMMDQDGICLRADLPSGALGIEAWGFQRVKIFQLVDRVVCRSFPVKNSEIRPTYNFMFS